nr:hypothetical protein [Tanacetum cinerariifolium]
MFGTIPPIPPHFETSSGDPGSLNVNRVDMMPTTTNPINTSTTRYVSQRVNLNIVNNFINDPLYIGNSDHPGMVLTNTPFNGSNFMGWSRMVKMALADLSKNNTSMAVCPIGWSFMLQRELNNVSQENLSVAAYFNKLKKCWDELHNLNGVPLCSCAKMQEYTCNLVDKFLEIEGRSKLVQFLMKLNDDYESFRNQILSMDPLPNVNKTYYIVQQVEKQKQVTNHVADPMDFFANMYQNKFMKRDTKDRLSRLVQREKEQKRGKLAANVDLSAKEVVAIGKGSRCLYTRTSLDPSASPSTQNSIVNSINVFEFLNNPVVSNYVHYNVVDLHTLHSRLGHLYVSKMIHVDECKKLNTSDFTCESCSLAKFHRLPFPKSTISSHNPFDLLHVDLWGPYKIPALNGVHYFYTIVNDKSRATLTYLVHSKDQVLTAWKTPFEILHGTPSSYEALKTIGCLCYAASLGPNRDKFDPKGIRCVLIGYPPGQKGYQLYNLSTHEVIHSRDVVFQESVFPFKEPVTTFAHSTVKPVCYPDISTGEEVDVPEAPTTTPLPDQTTKPIRTHEDNVTAMEKELAALEQNKTWELTNLPIGHKPITSKWNISVVLIYVDDVLVTADSIHEIAQVKEALDQKFTIKDMREAKHFLGIEVCMINIGTHLNQRKYILDLLQDAGLTTCKPNPSPLPTSLHLSLDKVTLLTDNGVYRRLVGRLLYLTMTSPDISYVVQHLSQFVSAPKDTHMQAALYLLKYLKGTISKGFFYPVESQLKVTGFWGNCLMTRRSLMGYCIFLGHSLVSWKTKKQPTVSRSSTEGEYISMTTTTCELLWLSFLLKDLGINV